VLNSENERRESDGKMKELKNLFFTRTNWTEKKGENFLMVLRQS